MPSTRESMVETEAVKEARNQIYRTILLHWVLLVHEAVDWYQAPAQTQRNHILLEDLQLHTTAELLTHKLW